MAEVAGIEAYAAVEIRQHAVMVHLQDERHRARDQAERQQRDRDVCGRAQRAVGIRCRHRLLIVSREQRPRRCDDPTITCVPDVPEQPAERLRGGDDMRHGRRVGHHDDGRRDHPQLAPRR